MLSGFYRVVCVVLLFFLSSCSARVEERGPEYRVRVDAGAYDRENTPVSFAWPQGLRPGAAQLIDSRKSRIPVQMDGEGRGWFVVPDLPAGKSATYQLVPADSADVAGGVDVSNYGGTLAFRVDDRPVFQYHAVKTMLPRPDIDSRFERGGYIHPVFTPSGKLVTDDYPPNHVHHHGIWAAWTSTRFQGRTPDFWNMGDLTGTVIPAGLDTAWGGPVHGGLRTRHQYVDLSADHPTPVLQETWEVQVFNAREGVDPYWIFDLNVVHTTATDSALILPEYRYGGVGFRGNRNWDGAENTFFLTSEGKDRSNGHATRGRWVHVGGYVDGQLAGVAILDHPENFRAPQPMRIHPTEPFFNYAPSQAGDWAIRPGEPYVARYRFIVSDGPPDSTEINRLWNDYAHPPAVTVTAR